MSNECLENNAYEEAESACSAAIDRLDPLLKKEIHSCNLFLGKALALKEMGDLVRAEVYFSDATSKLAEHKIGRQLHIDEIGLHGMTKSALFYVMAEIDEAFDSSEPAIDSAADVKSPEKFGQHGNDNDLKNADLERLKINPRKLQEEYEVFSRRSKFNSPERSGS